MFQQFENLGKSSTRLARKTGSTGSSTVSVSLSENLSHFRWIMITINCDTSTIRFQQVFPLDMITSLGTGHYTVLFMETTQSTNFVDFYYQDDTTVKMHISGPMNGLAVDVIGIR